MKPDSHTTSATEQARRLQSHLDAPAPYEFPRAPEPYTFGDRKDTGRIPLGHGAFKTRKLGG